MHYKRRSRRLDKTRWAACGCCEIITKNKQEPVENEICNGKAKKTKPRPKKDRCPVKGTHEWYIERVQDTHIYRLQGARLHAWTDTYDKKTCIHCWKEVKKRIYEPYRGYRDRPKVLPKRPVKF